MARRTPWLCGEDSTAVTPTALARRHKSRVTDDEQGDLAPSNGASTKKELVKKGKKKETLMPPLFASSCIPSMRKAHARSGDGRTSEKTMEASFSTGLGAGLFFLYVKSATEVRRMVELRAEMESLLGEIRGTIPITVGSSSSECSDGVRAGHRGSVKVQSAASSASPEDRQLACLHGQKSGESSHQHTTSAGAESRTMEQLEAELESELQRLQLDMESDGSATPWWEVKVIADSRGTSRADGESFEADDLLDHEANDSRLNCENGVCPRELEMRLYKLLDLRHRERITELESALEEANRNMHEKDKEIQWWRSTNLLALDTRREGSPSREKRSCRDLQAV